MWWRRKRRVWLSCVVAWGCGDPAGAEDPVDGAPSSCADVVGRAGVTAERPAEVEVETSSVLMPGERRPTLRLVRRRLEGARLRDRAYAVACALRADGDVRLTPDAEPTTAWPDDDLRFSPFDDPTLAVTNLTEDYPRLQLTDVSVPVPEIDWEEVEWDAPPDEGVGPEVVRSKALELLDRLVAAGAVSADAFDRSRLNVSPNTASHFQTGIEGKKEAVRYFDVWFRTYVGGLRVSDISLQIRYTRDGELMLVIMRDFDVSLAGDVTVALTRQEAEARLATSTMEGAAPGWSASLLLPALSYRPPGTSEFDRVIPPTANALVRCRNGDEEVHAGTFGQTLDASSSMVTHDVGEGLPCGG